MNEAGSRCEMRTYLSSTHLRNAVAFALQSDEHEHDNRGIFNNENASSNHRFVIGAIFSATAFLEATINEIIVDAILCAEPDSRRRMQTSTAMLLSDRLRNEIINHFGGIRQNNWGSLFVKYRYLVAENHSEVIPEGRGTIGYHATSLTNIRNRLVHYTPENIISWDTISEEGPNNADTLSERLQERVQGLFELSPFAGPLEPFFPNRCLSGGCAFWVTRIAIEYIEIFFQRLNIPNSMFARERREAMERIQRTH